MLGSGIWIFRNCVIYCGTPDSGSLDKALGTSQSMPYVLVQQAFPSKSPFFNPANFKEMLGLLWDPTLC